jgi:hypothetical protein
VQLFLWYCLSLLRHCGKIKLSLVIGWNELTKDQFTDITGKNYDTGVENSSTAS